MKPTLLAVPILLVLNGCQTSSPRANVTVLAESLQPLRERFNADSDRLRVVALFSPT